MAKIGRVQKSDHKPPEQSKGDNTLTQTSFRRWNGCLPLFNPIKNLTFGVGHSHNTWQLSWFSSTALYSSHIGQQQKMGSWTEAKLKTTTAYYSKTRKGMNKQVEKKQTIQRTYIHPPLCKQSVFPKRQMKGGTDPLSIVSPLAAWHDWCRWWEHDTGTGVVQPTHDEGNSHPPTPAATGRTPG